MCSMGLILQGHRDMPTRPDGAPLWSFSYETPRGPSCACCWTGLRRELRTAHVADIPAPEAPPFSRDARSALGEMRRASGRERAAKVAVIIVNYKTPELAKRCLSSLHGEKDLLPELRAIVVDGGSADGSA